MFDFHEPYTTVSLARATMAASSSSDRSAALHGGPTSSTSIRFGMTLATSTTVTAALTFLWRGLPRQSEMLCSLARMNLISTQHAVSSTCLHDLSLHRRLAAAKIETDCKKWRRGGATTKTC